jgi:hypothetical protein
MKKTLRFSLLALLALFGMGSAMAEDIIWQEDFSSYKADDVPSGGTYNYVCTDNGTNLTKVYNANNVGGTSPELLIGKKNNKATNPNVLGTFSATINLNGKSGNMALSFKANGILTIEVIGGTLGDNTVTGNDYIYPISNASGTLTIKFTNNTSSNIRIDNIKLYQGTAKKPAGLSWGKVSASVTLGNEDESYKYIPTLQNENQLNVTCTSSDTNVATVTNSGEVTVVGVGETVITASFAGNDEFEAAEVSYTLTVKGQQQGGDTPTAGQTPETAISVSEALAIINQLADKATTSETYYVKGTVSSIKEISVGYGNATFDLGDGSTNNLTAYQLKGFNNEKINNANLFKVNDELIVVGKLQKFVDNDGGITPEIKSGYIYSVNGQTEDNTPSPEETVKAGKVGLDAENPMTVDQALAYINDFPANYKTEGKYYVEGKVTAIEEISTKNGNATFTIAASQINAPRRASFSELVAYRLKGLEDQAIVEDDYLKVGDEVVVCAQLQNYKDEKAELSGGYIYKKVTTGIQAITVDDAKAPVYSLDGRRVDESYHGVVIKNGKKYVK